MDEACIPGLSSILLAVSMLGFFFILLCLLCLHTKLNKILPFFTAAVIKVNILGKVITVDTSQCSC